MFVKDLALKFKITEEVITSTLKAIKLRAKGEDQLLSPAVLMVLLSELEAKGIIPKEIVPEKTVKKASARTKVQSDASSPARKKKKVILPVEETSKEKPVIVMVTKLSEVPKKVPVEKVVEHIAKPVLRLDDILSQQLVSAETEPVEKESVPVVSVPAEVKEQKTQTEEIVTVNQDGKKVTKKVVTTVITVTKKKTEAPAFIAIQPLKKKGREDRSFGFDPTTISPELPSNVLDSSSVTKVANDPVVKGPLTDLEIKIPVTVGDLAFKMQQKVNAVLKVLMKMGVFANINQNLGEDIVRKICDGFGFNLIEVKSQEELLIHEHSLEKDDPMLLVSRAPVVTFMGHVDHGKTSLLDAIRKTKVVDSEHGGITQHISAYSVKVPRGTITFLDTPGHAAFTAMRSRGAHITDIVVLVVAANEGLMPQTEEAIDHARAAGVPIVVALNKMDRPDADPERVKKQLMEKDLMSEDWGGKTVVVPVSAHTGAGLDTLLEMILLESEMLQLKANPDKRAAGIVVEAHMSPGKGSLATLIIQSGTLKENDIIVVGPYVGKIKAMFDDRQRNVKFAGPSMPVEILGLPAVPEAGERFFVAEDEKTARDIATVREEKIKLKRLKDTSKITLEDLLAQRESGETKELNLIVKADVQGSLEALKGALLKIPSESKEVSIKFIHSGVGEVNPSDIILAHVSKAIIIAFNVGKSSTANDELERSPVEVRRYNVIYDIVNDIRVALEGMLKPDVKRHFLARAEVRQVFNLTKSGIVAGCIILKGKMRSKSSVDILRNAVVIHTGKIVALKRFKDDVKEVGEGFECGISVDNYTEYAPGDIIESFELEHIARKL